MLVKDGRSDSIVGLFLSITILLSSRSLVQSRFIDELESIFVTLKNRNYKAYDLMCRKYMIPKNICSLLRKI